jgi:hypothetical protein
MATAKKPTTTKTEVETTKAITGKTVYGIAGLQNPTPKWATWLFRGEFLLNKGLTIILAGTHAIPQDKLAEYILWVTAIDTVFWAFARQVGIQKPEE